VKNDLFRTILCPVDFSGHSRRALQYAALLARRNEGRIIALFVEDPLLAAAAAGTRIPEITRAQLQRFVERAVAPFGVDQRSIRLETVTGKPPREIVTAARLNRCDLIVMGTHGITGAVKLMLGSTTERVLRTAPVPVLAIPPARVSAAALRAWPAKPALTPLKLERRFHHDLALASDAAAALGTVLALVHVVPPRQRTQLLKARGQLERMVQSLEFETVVSGRVLAGKPAEQIAAMAENTDVDLVILTRRRGDGLLGSAPGSISYQLLCHAQTPVLALSSTGRRRSQVHDASSDGRRRAS
jgi:nucleotide-binding universal stress UspA family protein